ncbi:MAG: inositol-3-phosphate synthase [Candidatus Micrarchaeota archaeon]
MGKIKCAFVGLGNCCSGLLQGIEFYRQNPDKKVIGIMHENMGGYTIYDIEAVAAFDVGENKVGKPMSEALYASPNMVNWVAMESMPQKDVVVMESPALDGVGIWVENKINPIKSGKSTEELRKEIIERIKSSGTAVIINYLPVGSQKAVEFWAEVALECGCAFVNSMPVFIASTPAWEKRFTDANLPVVGDDIKGMIGATIVHRTLARLCDERGGSVDKTYQINVGGNTDFCNMLERERLESKKISKTESVQSQLSKRLPDDQIYVGPSDFIPFLGNTKLMFMRIEGRMWADVKYNMEVRLEVDDKANSGGIVIDAIRAAKIALDRRLGGAIIPASAYLMKHPPKQMTDPDARKALEEYIRG